MSCKIKLIIELKAEDLQRVKLILRMAKKIASIRNKIKSGIKNNRKEGL